MTSATIGPTRTRVRLPSGTIEATVRADVVDGRVGRQLPPERDLPRVDREADAARGRIGAPGGAAGVEHDLGEPVGAGRRGAREQGRPGEARDERIGGRGDELRGGAALEDRAVDDHADLIGERGGVLEVVGDEDGRQRELAEQLVELDPHRRLGVRVESRQRLVEQQDARLERERPRERDPLALAARELARPAPRVRWEILNRSRSSATGALRPAPKRTFASTSR